MIVKRHLNLEHLLQQKSHFLFGPRAVGKSTLIAQQLADKALFVEAFPLHTTPYDFKTQLV